MRKTYIILLLILPLLVLGAPKEGKFLGAKDVHLPDYTYESFLDFSEDVENLQNENKRLILLVHQKNCPYCARFSEKILSLDSIKNKVTQNFGMVEFNMFGDREVVGFDGEDYTEKEYAKKLGLQFTPAVLFFDENKTKVLQLNGFIKENKFSAALDYIKEKQEKKMSFNQYLANKATKSQNDTLVKADFINTNLKSLARSTSKKELAVLFETPHCQECVSLHQTYLNEPMINNFIKQLDVARINLNNNKVLVTPKKLISYSNDFASSLQVSSAPAIVFFDTNGDEIIRIDSLYKTFHMQSIFDYVVSGAYKTQKEFQRYLTDRSRAIRKKGVDVDIWK